METRETEKKGGVEGKEKDKVEEEKEEEKGKEAL